MTATEAVTAKSETAHIDRLKAFVGWIRNDTNLRWALIETISEMRHFSIIDANYALKGLTNHSPAISSQSTHQELISAYPRVKKLAELFHETCRIIHMGEYAYPEMDNDLRVLGRDWLKTLPAALGDKNPS